jgi:hypothetical protein
MKKRTIIIYLFPALIILFIGIFIGVQYYYAVFTTQAVPNETVYSIKYRISKQLFFDYWYLLLLILGAYLWMKGLGERVLLGTGKVYNPTTNRYFKIYPKISQKEMNFSDAEKFVSNLKGTWRLPTIDELGLIFEQLDNKGKIDMEISSYWSSSREGDIIRTLNCIFRGLGLQRMKGETDIGRVSLLSEPKSSIIAVKDL